MERFKQNLENLTQVRPDLAGSILFPLPPRVELQTARSGMPTLLYRTSQGERLLHSRYDPVKEAVSLAASLMGDWDHLVMMGLGLGYHVLPLLENKSPRQRILLFEPDPAIFTASLHLIDWGRLLSSRDDLYLTVGPDEGKLAEEVQRFFSLTRYEKLHLAHFPAEKNLFSDLFGKAERAIDSQIRTLFYDFKTRLAEGGMVSQNILRNLPHILKTRPLKLLEERFKDHPGIIVSAGPSLDENIALLHRVKDRAVIVAVDTALKPLLARGIQPHFTVTADPSHKNYRHLLGTEGRIHHFLLAESAVSTRVFQDFCRQTFTVSLGKPLLKFIERATGPIGELDAWGSVISLALSFSVTIGLDPLTFIGQDFAYTHMRNHCRHSSWEESLLLENPSLESLQRFERQSIRGQMVETTDLFGRPVYSSDRLVLYKDYLVRMLNAFSGRRITNSSEGGILKEIPFLPLDEFLRRHLPGRKPVDFSRLNHMPALGAPKVNEQIRRLFSAQVRFLKKYRRKMLPMIERLGDKAETPPPSLLDEAEELKQALYRQERHGTLVEMWSQYPIYTFLSGQKKLPANPADPRHAGQYAKLYRSYFQSLYLQISVMINAFEKVTENLIQPLSSEEKGIGNPR